MRPRSLTRTELHQLVWSQPLTKLSQEFGLSAAGLKKICDRHRIPTPPQGHWTRVQLGQSPPVIPLPESEDADPNAKIHIAPAASRAPQAAQEDIARLKAEARSDQAAPPDFTPRPTNELHAALIATAKHLRAAEPDRDGRIDARGEGLLGLSIGVAHSERLIAFLDALFRALAERGIAVEADGSSIAARRGPDAMKFNLKGKREERIYRPTEAERAAEEERQRRNARRWSKNDFDIPYSAPVYPARHSVFSGQYTLQIESWIPGVRKTWADARTQTLESLFPDIAAGIDACLVAEAARRAEREEQARLWKEEAERRARARARAEREAERGQFLSQLIAGEDEARRLQAWLSRAPPAEAAPHPWPPLIAWAQARLAALQSRSEPNAVIAMLAERDADLFPDPDPLADDAVGAPEEVIQFTDDFDDDD